MINPFKSIKEWAEMNKKETWFKPVVLLLVLSVLAFGADRWRKWEDSKEVSAAEILEETSYEDEEESNILQTIWDENKLHFIVFGGLSVTLFIVKCRNAVKLEESGGNIKK